MTPFRPSAPSRRMLRPSITVSLALIFLLNALSLKAQDPQQALDSLVALINTKAADFRIPTTTTTETLGTLDLSSGVSPYNLGKLFTYAPGIQTYSDGSFDITTLPSIPCEANCRPHALPPAHFIQTPKKGAMLTELNISNLSIRIVIKPLPANMHVGTGMRIHLGTAEQDLPLTATEAVFTNVVGDSLPFWVELNGFIGGYNAQGLPIIGTALVKGLSDLKMTRPTAGAGALVIPVVPVTIVYSPMVDAQKKNTAGFTQAHVMGNATTLSFSKQNSQTNPIDSTFQSTVDAEKGMSEAGAALSKIPTPYTQAAGAALTFIASGMGSSVATETISTSITAQQSLGVTETTANTLTTAAGNGGPGVSDTIVYYPNVRVVWYTDGGPMKMAVLGSGVIQYVSAQKLKDAQECLKQTPVCADFASKYAPLKIDAAAIASLLALDPFVAGGPTAVLDPNRFSHVDAFEMNGVSGSKTYSNSVQVSSGQTLGTAKIVTDVQKDTPGFLSFLGIGITQDDQLQTQISQSSSSQANSAQSIAETYTLNQDGHEYYATEVFLDKAYGSLAFRDITDSAKPPMVVGRVADPMGNAVGNATVSVVVADRKFSTLSDAEGKFSFRLPGVTSGHIKFKSGEGEVERQLDTTKPTSLDLLRK